MALRFFTAGESLKKKLLLILPSTILIGTLSMLIGCGQVGSGGDIKVLTPTVAANSGTSLLLKGDGTVWAWGRNDAGQLGNGTNVQSARPTQVKYLTKVIAVSVGYFHALAVKSDGTVWGWGSNGYGKLGKTITLEALTPVQIPIIDGVRMCAAGRLRSLAVKLDGTVWFWGAEHDSGGTVFETPKKVDTLSDGVTAIAGESFSIVLKSDGTVWGWGSNGKNQLGDGTTTDRTEPVKVLGLNNVKSIAGQGRFTLALRDDGTVWAWGDNIFGPLGRPATVEMSSVPLQVEGLSKVVAVACGTEHALALKDDGTVWTWGSNANGQLGYVTSPNFYYNPPAQVPNLNNVASVAAGSAHSLALKSDGSIWAWGFSSFGQVGEGATSREQITPVKVSLGQIP